MPSTEAGVRAMGREPIAARLTAARLRLGAQLLLPAMVAGRGIEDRLAWTLQRQRTRTNPVIQGMHAVQLDHIAVVQLQDSESRYVLSVDATTAPRRRASRCAAAMKALERGGIDRKQSPSLRNGIREFQLHRPQNVRDQLISAC